MGKVLPKTKRFKDAAIRKIYATRGLPVEIAKACGVKRQALDFWQHVPPQHVATVSKYIDMPLHQIRPDIFPKS